jgi:hypothetical protein
MLRSCNPYSQKQRYLQSPAVENYWPLDRSLPLRTCPDLPCVCRGGLKCYDVLSLNSVQFRDQATRFARCVAQTLPDISIPCPNQGNLCMLFFCFERGLQRDGLESCNGSIAAVDARES